MILAKDLKELINQLPDDKAVMLGDSYECNIKGWSYDTMDGFIKLDLTEGYGITSREYLDSLFDILIENYRLTNHNK